MKKVINLQLKKIPTAKYAMHYYHVNEFCNTY